MDFKKINFKDKKIWIGLVIIAVVTWFLFGESKSVSVAKAMNENNSRVWFLLDDEKPTEESQVEYVLTSRLGKVVSYASGADLEEFKGMSDSDIVSKAIADDKKQSSSRDDKRQKPQEVKFETNIDNNTLESITVSGVKNTHVGYMGHEYESNVYLDNLIPQKESVKLFGKDYAVFQAGGSDSLITPGGSAQFDDPNGVFFQKQD